MPLNLLLTISYFLLQLFARRGFCSRCTQRLSSATNWIWASPLDNFYNLLAQLPVPFESPKERAPHLSNGVPPLCLETLFASLQQTALRKWSFHSRCKPMTRIPVSWLMFHLEKHEWQCSSSSNSAGISTIITESSRKLAAITFLLVNVLVLFQKWIHQCITIDIVSIPMN